MKAYYLVRACCVCALMVLATQWIRSESSTYQKMAREPFSASTDDKPQLVVQIGHSNGINSVAFSPDGKYVLTGSEDHTARLWEAVSGTEIRSFTGHSSSVTAVAFSPDGKYALTGSEDQTMIMWEVESGINLASYEGPVGPVNSVTFIPGGGADENYVITGGLKGWAWSLWRARRGSVISPTESRSFGVLTIAASPDSKYVLSGGEDLDAHLWSLQSGKEIRAFTGHSDVIFSVAISHDGKYALTGSGDKTARLWEVASGKQVRSFIGHSSIVNAVTFSPDGKYVLTGSSDQTARLWEASSGKQIRGFTGHSSAVLSVTFSPDGRYVLTGEKDKTARLWEVASGRLIRPFAGRAEEVLAIAASPDDKYVLSGGSDGAAHLWSLESGKEVVTFRSHSDMVSAVAFSPDSKYALTGGGDHSARLWEVASGQLIRAFTGHFGNVSAVAFSPDGKYVLTGSWDNTARFWEAASGKQIRIFTGPKGWVTSVSFSPDGNYALITGILEWGVRLHDINSDKFRMFGKSSIGADCAVFSRDGRYVLGSIDGTARLWEAASGDEIRSFPIELDSPYAVDFSPDGKSVLTAGRDHTVRLWEVASRKVPRVFAGHSGWVSSVKFSPSGKYVLSGSWDSTIHIWSVSDGKDLCRLIALRDGNWVSVDSEGHFDTNNLEQIKGLDWVMPDDPMTPLPLEIFTRDYYEPRLLSRILSGEKFRTRSVAQINRVQPLVKIVGVEQQGKSDLVTVTVEATKAKSERQRDGQGNLRETGVYDLRLFRDGQLVGQHSDGIARPLAVKASEEVQRLAWREENKITLDASGKRIIRFENIWLPRKADVKQVEFSAYAFNEDRVKSQTDRYTFKIPADLTPLRGRAYVVMFGVNACEAECRSLDYAVNDVRKMQQTFVNKLKQGGQYEAVVEIPLIADYHTETGGKRVVAEKSATKPNLKAIFGLLSGKPVDHKLLAGIPNAAQLRQARPEDMLLVFFSSHGDTDGQGIFYIVPYDIGQSRLCAGKAISDEEYNGVLSRCISSEELSLWLRYVDAGEMMMIVDACHSAAAVQSDEFKPGPMGSRGLGQLAYDKGLKILAATQSDNVAREFKELNQSLLSYVLTKEGIEEGRADFKPVDQIVTMTEWLQYSEARVPKWYEEKQKEKAKQNPSSNAEPAEQSDRRFKHRGNMRQVQIPSLFDFTHNRRDSILFKKASTLKQ